jgi:regulator of nucleoside diphosphate kinase
MFRNKTTITRPDRDRLLRTTHSKTNLLRWSLFIDELAREIDRARVIDPSRVPNDTVTMHSTVRIRDTGRDAPEVYTLVYPDEASPQLGKLSVLTPVGTALLGTRVGDVLRVATADGIRRIRVEAILYQPEDAARRARTRAALRRARRGELMLVYALSAIVLLVMLPVVLAVVGAWMIVTLSRRAKPRLLDAVRRFGGTSVGASAHLSTDDKETDDEVSGVVRPRRLTQRLAPVRRPAARRASRARGRGSGGFRERPFRGDFLGC